MSESYTVIYEVDGCLRPHTHTVTEEIEAIQFASHYPCSRIRRDSDCAYYDKGSGTWQRIAGYRTT